jgi:hypothetical protein
MEEKLISLKTAKLAKEKGYNWKQSGCYLHPPKFILSPHGHIQNHNKYKERSVYSAPTQALLQKWLREKHNVYCEVHSFTDDKGNKKYESIVFSELFEDDWSEDINFDDVFNTYEDALEDTFEPALNLLPNV